MWGENEGDSSGDRAAEHHSRFLPAAGYSDFPPTHVHLKATMIWYVSATQGADSNDGKSMLTAFKSLSHAVAVAKSGDTIQIAPGAYDQNLPEFVSRARTADVAVAVAGGG
jgi:hypothetical protein